MESAEKISYINTFINDHPKNGIDSPHTRILSAIKINDELAEYFRDRAQVEDTYAKNIAKLAKKNYITNKSTLGSFLPLWEMLQIELSRLAVIHSEYASMIIKEIEQPLRSSIQRNADYATIHQLEYHLQKVAKEVDELENKIQKQKKSVKAAELSKQQEQKLDEWVKEAPQFLQSYQNVDEFRLDNLKTTVHKFEAIQQTHAEKIIELTGNGMIVVSNLNVHDEVASFCSSHTITNPSIRHVNAVVTESLSSSLSNMGTSVPEYSVAGLSVKQPIQMSTNSPTSLPVKKEKKRFFSGLGSIRRKPKAELNLHQVEPNLHSEQTSHHQHSLSNSESYVESSSFQSVHTHSTNDHQHDTHLSKGANLSQPNSPVSINPPVSLHNQSNGSFTNVSTPQHQLIQVDSEGYSIPPPDRTTWIGDQHNTGDILMDTDEINSDSGSALNSPRIRINIKNEVVNAEDASQSAVALTRVATLLKEKNSANTPTTRRLRGRREMRATQLYSVTEQSQILSDFNNEYMNQQTVLNDYTKTLTNPFETSQSSNLSVKNPLNNLELPTIDVHINETVHLVSKEGVVKNSIIFGEISIDYHGPANSETPICFKIKHSSTFNAIETTEFINVYNMEDYIFKVNTKLYHERKSDKHQVCIKYQINLNKDRVPLSVKPMWKCDADKSRLLIKYHKNQSIPTIDNVTFITSVTGNVQNALSIPFGEFILSQNKIKWHLDQINSNNVEVIKAQFTILEQGIPQPIAIRFELKDQLLTDLNIQPGIDPIVLWAKVSNVTKTVKSGKYIADV